MDSIFAAKSDLKQLLRGIDGVKSIGLSKTAIGTPYLVVFIDEDTPKSAIAQIPATSGNFNVKIMQIHSLELH